MHSIIGGSIAYRILNCPGSVQACLALPQAVEVRSEFAEEGTAMHQVMADLMSARSDTMGGVYDSLEAQLKLARSWIGRTFHDRELTKEHYDTMVEPALQKLAELEEIYGGHFEVMAVEAKVRFPDLFDAYGTVDLVLASNRHLLHIDWKFGAGVPVFAIKDNILNSQLMYYVTAARYTAPRLYKGKVVIVGAIIQPRAEAQFTHAVIRKVDIEHFRVELTKAVRLALQPQAKRVRGEWCRFAACKLTCPLWVGPVLDLAVLDMPPTPPVGTVGYQLKEYGAFLSRAKALADMAAQFSNEVNAQVHAFLESGGEVPGWKLKYKQKVRQWVDEKLVEKALRKLGFDGVDIWRQKLVTFQSADATARRLKVTIPEELRVAPPSSETVVTSVDDPAPAVNRVHITEQFRKALEDLS